MNRASNSGSAFGDYQDIHFGGRNLPSALDHALRRFRLPDQIALRRRGEGRGGAGEHAARGFLQLVEADGLDEVVAGTGANRLDGFGHRAKSGEENHAGARGDFTNPSHHAQAVAIGHAHVGDDQRAGRAAEFDERIVCAVSGGDVPAVAAEMSLERFAHGRFVVDYEHLVHASLLDAAERGKISEKVVPLPGSLATSMRP